MKNILNNLLNLVFPEKYICFVCEDYGKDIEGNLCSICREKLVFIDDDTCSICGRKLDRALEVSEEILEERSDKGPKKENENIRRCSECIKHPHYFIKSVSPLSYEGDIKEIIYDFKYNGKHHLYKLFGQLMLDRIIDNDLEHIDLIVPVPLYKDREKKRGFNQAALLSKYLAKKLRLESDDKNLIRKKQTQVQNKLNRAERVRNISGVFDLKDKDKFKDKTILLIDDIYTTGSTVDEISKLLVENHAKQVFVTTLAVTPNKEYRSWDRWILKVV